MRARTRTRQQGVAIITALLLTTLSITIVASLFWQQQVQVRSMENQRLHLQTKWILRGALDWARLVLRQDGMDSPEYTSLHSVWATPLADTRLDQYIERERVEGEVFNATLSGRVLDACARFNLANLAEGRVIDLNQRLVFRRLLTVLQLDPALADRTALAVASSAPVAPTALGTGSQTPPPPPPPGQAPVPSNGSEPIALTRVEDLLAIQGYTPEIVEKLRDFVIVLPEHTKINVNTAPAEVLAALVGVSLSEGSSMVSRREQADFRQPYQFVAQARKPELDTESFALKSEYFLVNSRIRLDRAALDAQALVNRKTGPGAVTTTIWVRQF